MKIGILGASGFIGGHLVDHYLTLGHVVIGIDNQSTGQYINPNAKNYTLDLLHTTQTKLIEILGECDVIIHLASTARVQPSFDDPAKYFTNNLGNLSNVLNSLKGWKGKFIYISSSSVYGNTVGSRIYQGLGENQFLNPSSPYGVTKKMAEELCLFYKSWFGLDVKIIRPFNIYGNRMSTLDGYKTSLQVWIEQFQNNEPLTVFGDGLQTRDFTHIFDFIQGLDLIINTNKKDLIYNISSGVNYSVNASVASFPYTAEVKYLEAKNEPKHTKGNIKLLKSLGYEPKYNVLEWIQQYFT